MNELEVRAIRTYISEFLFEPQVNWPQLYFDERCYSIWAANEILQRILDHPFIPASKIIDEFAIKCSYFACFTENATANFIFSVALDVADDILDVLRAMN